MTDFETKYQEFIEKHEKAQTSRALHQLLQGIRPEEHAFLKNVWWPAFGNFENLHPHYEVQNTKGGFPFVDFAYIERCLKIAIQIDVFEEWRSQTDEDLSLDCDRQSMMVLGGWRVLRYADVMKEKDNDHARRGLKRFLDDWHERSAELKTLTDPELDVLEVFGGSHTPMTFREIYDRLTISSIILDRLLYKLVKSHWLGFVPDESGERRYAIHDSKPFLIC